MIRAISYARAGDPADVLEVADMPDPPTPGHGQIQGGPIPVALDPVGGAIATMQTAEFDVAGTYTLDQISAAVHHVKAPGKIGTVVVKFK